MNNVRIQELADRGIQVSEMSAMEREYFGIEGDYEKEDNAIHGGVVGNRELSNGVEIPFVISAEQYSHLGKYAGALVLMCFEKIGGMEAFSNWAKVNPTDFYTKMFGKVIATSRTVETNGGADDNAMMMLEGDFRSE